MRPVETAEIVPLESYARVREAYRRAVIAHKRHRRVSIGENVTLVFEDRETLRFQIQEMLWIERIADETKVRGEVEVYNELVPEENELSATLFVEITDVAEVRPELDRLVGIDEHVALLLGEGDAAPCIPARFDPKQMEEDRISAVQYIRFPLGEDGARRFADPAIAARLRIDHPAYRHEAALPEDVRQSLAATLATDPPSLMPDDPGPPPSPELLFETPRIRALRIGGPSPGGRVIVESREPVSFVDADPEFLAELSEALQRAAASLQRGNVRCRIWTELGPEGSPMRWHLEVPES